MADPFTAIVAFFVQTFAYAGLGYTAATVAAYAAATFVYASALFALNSISKSMLPSGKRGQSLELNYAGTAEPIRYVFGTQKIGGMMVIPPICTGNDGKFLHIVAALAGGGETGIEEIGDVYFDSTVITSASIGAVTGTANDGLVSSGQFQNRAWIRRYKGTTTDLPSGDYILNNAYPSAFTSAFRGRGIAKLFITCKYSQKVYKTGIPNFTAMVKGCKVYDPRLDSTNGGSGSQRYTDATTWTWSSNPALCARHYLVKISRRADDIDIDDNSIIAAANICDQLVNIPGATTQKRWQCNITLAASDDWRENLKVIVDTMRGRALRRDGKWYLYAGAWDSPTVSISKSDWVSPTVIKASLDKAERWNAVRVFYVDPTRNWQRVQCFPRRNTLYEAADGERIWFDLDLPGVSNEYEAQRHGEITLRQSRNQLMMTGKLRPEFMKLAVWDTVTVNDDEYGFVSKTFRVASMDMATDGSVTVGLIEEGSALWNDLASGDYNTQTTTLTLDPGATFPETPTGLVAIGERSQINFNWQPGEDELFGQAYEIIESTNSGNASIGTPVWQGIAYNAIVPKTDTTTRWYWVRGIVGSYYSAYNPNTFGVAACASSAPTDGTPGTYAPLLDLRATAQQFRFSGSGTNIGVNTIAFDADLTGIAGTVGFRVSNFRQDGTGIASYDLAGSGNNNRILNVNSFTQNGTTAYAIVTASLGYSVSDFVTDRISVVRLREGSDGSNGTNGSDALVGYLTNENHTLPASSNGFVPAYTDANGSLVLMRGVNSVSVSSITFSVPSNPQSLTNVFSTNGTFAVTGGFDVAEVIASLTLRGAAFGANVDKVFTLNKALAGAEGTSGSPAQTLDLLSTGQVFRFSGSSTNIGVSTIGFDAQLQNISGTAGFYAQNYRSDGTLLNSYALSGTGNTNRGLHINSFSQNNSTAYATIVSSISGGFSDRITVVRVAEGAGGIDGTNGSDALVAYLTNENHTLPASSNGFVPGYTGANGTMVVLRGVNSVSVSSITFSVPANPQSLTNVFSTNGTFAVTAGLDAGEDLATLTLRAATFGSNLDKIFTLGKAIGGLVGTSGAPAQTLDLLSTGQTFRYSGSATNIGVSTIGFDAILQNITGTTGFYANNYRADGTLLSSYNLGGSGNSNRSLHINSFTQNNSTSYCVIVASISGGFSDRITVIRVQEGASGNNGTDGQNAVVAYLTNEAHTLPASSNGNVTNYDGALGKFMLYEGTTFISDSVNSVTYSINANPQTLTASISNVGSYIVTGGLDIAETSATLTLRAAYKGTNYDKIFSLGKSLAGNTGFTGGIGPPGSNILSNGLFQYVDSATGLLANWDYGSTVVQSYDNTGGQDGGRCMFIGSHNTNRMYLNGDLIPVNPFQEYLEVSVWLRAVNSGHRAYLTVIPYDEFGNPILSHQEQMHTILSPSSGFYNPGATTIRMAKIDQSDRGFARKGYQNSFNYINFIGRTTSYFSALDIYWPHSANIQHSHLVTSINSSSSTSFDTLTISPSLPNTVREFQTAGLSNVAAYSYQCFPSNTYVTVSSTWTKYQELYGGETQGYARFLFGNPTTPGNERSSFRPRTKFVRFGIFLTTDGTESGVYVDDYIVQRRQNIPTAWTNDTDGTLGGGSWMGPLGQTRIGSLGGKQGLGVYYSANSGYSGNGCLVSVAADSPSPYDWGMPVK